ncbi:DUF4065 domain-containing protein [Clostridium butyricum]|uniref:Panacea domain-containing protein n=1 Tax=Clostridium butyricum TaxID=1492 RepID=UPI00136A74C6|nr:type II toxin-antitoxin system antitoxin SocA domain-containing protein [Clostridium butyricum]MZI80204.1 DUF4065 domain-containing protein [Clostridium butyricum]
MGKLIYFNRHLDMGEEEMNIFDVADAVTSIYGEKMTHKKLQKLCYYVYAWNIALLEDTVINERFEAWVHGPVSPNLYSKYRGQYLIEPANECPRTIKENEEIFELVNQIIRIYGSLDGDELEALTHSEEPWQVARGSKKPWESSNEVLDKDIISNFYCTQLQNQECLDV